MCGLTFELRGRQRWDARPGLVKMYRVPPDRAWWPAVGAPFERGVRHQCARQVNQSVFSCIGFCFPLCTTARGVAVPSLCGVPLILHGAARLEAPTTNLNSWRLLPAPCADSMQHGPVLHSSERPSTFPKLATVSCHRLWRLRRVFGLAGAHAGPDCNQAVRLARFGSWSGCFESGCSAELGLRLGRLVAVQPTPAGALPAGGAEGCLSDA